MSNALAISPSVMINRMAESEGAPAGAALVKVAELRMNLLEAVDREQHEAATQSPTGEATALPLSSGAVVDKLI